ncbi:MAG: DUF6531 domain-containing protein [Salinigranum sp.]
MTPPRSPSERVFAVLAALLVVLGTTVTPVAADLTPTPDALLPPDDSHLTPGSDGYGAGGDAGSTSDPGVGSPGDAAGSLSGAAVDPAVNNGTTAAVARGDTGYEPWYSYVAGVNTANGNLFRAWEDLSIGARGGRLRLFRSYNGNLSAEHGPVGFGWTLNYDRRLEARADGSVVFFDADGSTLTFARTTSGYTPPPGLHARLARNASGFTLWQLNGTREFYDANGTLRRIVDRNGNRVRLSYVDGNLTAVSDDSGQRLDLRYDAAGRVTAVTDPLGRTVRYEYDVGDLVAVTDPTGATTRYEYYANHKLRGPTPGPWSRSSSPRAWRRPTRTTGATGSGVSGTATRPGVASGRATSSSTTTPA